MDATAPRVLATPRDGDGEPACGLPDQPLKEMARRNAAFRRVQRTG